MRSGRMSWIKKIVNYKIYFKWFHDYFTKTIRFNGLPENIAITAAALLPFNRLVCLWSRLPYLFLIKISYLGYLMLDTWRKRFKYIFHLQRAILWIYNILISLQNRIHIISIIILYYINLIITIINS